MTFKKHTDCVRQNTSNILSHVHTTGKIACVARDKCARCGVLFTHLVAFKRIAVARKRNSLETNHCGSFYNAKEEKQ